jgi:pyruvate kinase
MATLQRNLKIHPDWKSEGNRRKVRLTKIVCTIGPKTKDVASLEELMSKGMDVMRLNFSHGTHEYHAEVIANLRTALKNKGPGAQCAIMLDTKGPEIRTGKLKDKTLQLIAGQEIIVTTDLSVVGDSTRIVVDYQELVKSAKSGNKILISDGTIGLTIKEILDEKSVKCVVNHTAVLGENKNVHLPGSTVLLPAVSEKDKADLLFGVEQKVDMIAASFIRSAADVRQIRAILGQQGQHIKIISKIESTEGLENFKEIVDVSDGIMVARGDLGVELPMEQIFIAQKHMISICNAANKPVITATQMLESMIQNPRPTRAEATDVANAVLDGSDCVMLSGETASGNFPMEAVAYMDSICKEAEVVEAAGDYPSLFEALKQESWTTNTRVPEVVCSYAVRAANDLGASVIIVLTESGSTARLVAKYRPRVPTVCVTHTHETANFLLCSRACLPVVVPSMVGSDHLIADAMDHSKKIGIAKSGTLAVVVQGTLEGQAGNSNILKVLSIEGFAN